MTQFFPKTAAAALLAGLVALAAPAVAQQQQQQDAVDTTSKPAWPAGVEQWNADERNPADVDPDAAQKKGLTQPEVQRSLPPPPTEQGTRAPEPLLGGEEREQLTLYQMLKLARNAPAGLDGERIPRPNPLGSEPTTEMEPVGGPDYLFPEGYVE